MDTLYRKPGLSLRQRSWKKTSSRVRDAESWYSTNIRRFVISEGLLIMKCAFKLFFQCENLLIVFLWYQYFNRYEMARIFLRALPSVYEIFWICQQTWQLVVVKINNKIQKEELKNFKFNNSINLSNINILALYLQV